MANEQNLKPQPFKKGDDERRNLDGRPKKFVSSLKAQGYKLSEINDTYKTMLSMTKAQIEEAVKSPLATALEMMIGSAIIKAISKGDLSVLETLVSRPYGKPKETIEITIAPEIEAAKGLYEELVQSGVKPKQALNKVIKGAKINGFDLTAEDILDADTIG